MKKIICSCVFIAITVCLITGIMVFSSSAEEFTESYYTYTVFGGEATITDVSTAISGDVIIPSTLGGYPVTCIGDASFAYCNWLTYITIPNSVTSIGKRAFYDCSDLTSITIPNSVTSIGESAFYDCGSLTRVYITDITAWCCIDFSDCYANPLYCAKKLYLNRTLVTNLVIPDGVTIIGDYAFSGYSGLTSITVVGSNTKYH